MLDPISEREFYYKLFPAWAHHPKKKIREVA